MKVRRSFLSILASLFLLVVPPVAHAETKVLTAEATYTMGDGETPSFAEAMVLQKAKQMALEEAGTYVESYARIQNLDLTTDEIRTLAGGVLQVEVLDKSRTLIGDGLRFFVKIKAIVTTDKMEELAQRIRGKNVVQEYKKLQEDYTKLTKELETWKQLVAKTPPGHEREVALDQIHQREKALASLQNSETAFFHRLVSGEALVKQAKDERAVVDALFENILEQGHRISLGEPTSHKTSGDLENVKLRIPVTVRVDENTRLAMKEAALSLGGLARTTKFVRKFNEGEHETQGTVIRMGKDSEVARYFRERVSHLGLVITLALDDGQVLLCNDWGENENPRRMFYLATNPIVPVFATYQRHFIETPYGFKRDLAKEIEDGLVFGRSDNAPVHWVGSDEVLFPGTLKPVSSGDYSLYRFESMPDPLVVVFEDLRNFVVTRVVPVSQASRIKSIRAEYVERQPEAYSPSANKPTTERPRRNAEPPWWKRIFSIDEEKSDPPAPTNVTMQNSLRFPEQLSCTVEQ